MTIIVSLMILGLIIPLRPDYSDTEKRELAKFPAFSVSGLLDGSYFTDIQTWYTDTYPLREPLIAGGNTIKRLYGLHDNEIHGDVAKEADEIPDEDTGEAEIIEAPIIEEIPEEEEQEVSDETEEPEAGADGTVHVEPEAAGTVYIANKSGYEMYYFAKENADYYASMINTVRSKLSSDVTVYDLLVPTSFGIMLDDEIQNSLGGSNQKQAMDYIYGKLNSDVKQVNCFDILRRHNGEYIYFRTDHHWTALGAYYAYFQFCKEKGIKPHDITEYETKDYEGFLGTFYAASNKSKELSDPDTLKVYIPMGTNTMHHISAEGEELDWPIVCDVNNYSAGNKYSCFINGDNPYSEIHNPEIHDGSSCVVIKESFGNAFVPFLVDNYEYVYVIDHRYYKGSVSSLIEEKGIKDVIFVNHLAFTKGFINNMLGLF